MACEPENLISSAELTGLKADIVTIDDVVESSLDTTTTKSGKVINTLLGQLKLLGFQPPVTYAASIVFTTNDGTKTVDEAGVVYAPLPSALPFTTSGTFIGDDDARFFVVQGVTLGDLAANSGSSLIGYDEGSTGSIPTTVEAELQKTFYLTNYTTLQEALDAAAGAILYIDRDITILPNVTSTASDDTTVIGMPSKTITSTATVSDLYEVIRSGHGCNFFNIVFVGSVVDAAGYCAIETTDKDDVMIQRCHVTGYGDGLLVQNSDNVRLVNNTLIGAQRFGINAAKVTEFKVNNNTVRDVVQNDGIKVQSTLYTDSGTIYESSFISILDNTCTGCGRDGIDLAGYFDHVLVDRNICHGNTLQGIEIKLDDYEGLHDGLANAAFLTDSGASWTINEFVGKVILNKTDGSSATITANTSTTITGALSGGTDDDWDISDSYQIVNGSAVRIKIQNNLCGGSTGSGHGIRVDNLSKFTIQNNTCHDNVQSGIIVTTACTKGIISDNDLHNNIQSGIRIQGDANVGATSDISIYDNKSIDNGNATLHGIELGNYIDDIRVKGNDCYSTVPSGLLTNSGINISGTLGIGNVFITENYCPIDKLDVSDDPISMGSFSGDGVFVARNITHSSGIFTFDANDLTPSISGCNNMYVTLNDTTIKSLTGFIKNSYESGEFTIHVNDAFTKFIHGASLKLNGSVDFDATNGSMITFKFRNNVAYEVSRMAA